MAVAPDKMSADQPDKGKVMTFDPGPEREDDVIDTDDGGAIVKLGAEDEKKTHEFYDNIVEEIPTSKLDAMATRLLEAVERDAQSRKKHEKMYAEAIKRTGMGKEAPGGAEFEGASKAVHPLLTESSVDFASRA